jgi:hypothetical protein
MRTYKELLELIKSEVAKNKINPCLFCGSYSHKEKCDSPGAIVIGMTGCPAQDSKAKKRLYISGALK